MGKCYNCGKTGHCKSECKRKKDNKSRETDRERDEDEFGLVFFDVLDDSEILKKTVKLRTCQRSFQM